MFFLLFLAQKYQMTVQAIMQPQIYCDTKSSLYICTIYMLPIQSNANDLYFINIINICIVLVGRIFQRSAPDSRARDSNSNRSWCHLYNAVILPYDQQIEKTSVLLSTLADWRSSNDWVSLMYVHQTRLGRWRNIQSIVKHSDQSCSYKIS